MTRTRVVRIFSEDYEYLKQLHQNIPGITIPGLIHTHIKTGKERNKRDGGGIYFTV